MSEFKEKVITSFGSGALSPLEKDLLLTLEGYKRCGGTIWPSHATLADRVKRSERTVRRGLNDLRKRGWLVWEQQWRTVGARVRKSSNLYSLRVPEDIHSRRNGQNDRGMETEIKKKEETVQQSAIRQLRALGFSGTLDEIRAEIEASLPKRSTAGISSGGGFSGPMFSRPKFFEPTGGRVKPF